MSNRSDNHERQVRVIEALRQQLNLEVTMNFEEVQVQFYQLVKGEEYLELTTEMGPLSVWVSCISFGWRNRAAHDYCYTVFGSVEASNPTTYVRVIVNGESACCWVEYVATLEEGIFLGMRPVVEDLRYDEE